MVVLVERFGRKLLLVWCGLTTPPLTTPDWLVGLTPRPAARLVAGFYNELIVVFPFIAAIFWMLFRARVPVRVRILGEDRS